MSERRCVVKHSRATRPAFVIEARSGPESAASSGQRPRDGDSRRPGSALGSAAQTRGCSASAALDREATWPTTTRSPVAWDRRRRRGRCGDWSPGWTPRAARRSSWRTSAGTRLRVTASPPTWPPSCGGPRPPCRQHRPLRDPYDTDQPLSVGPPQNGTVFRTLGLPPDREWRFDAEGDEIPPLAFHTTRSIDYAIVLSGEIWAVLDATEVRMTAGDVLMQRGTSHAWSDRSDEPCLLALVLVGGNLPDEA